jgi:hypothetical protein
MMLITNLHFYNIDDFFFAYIDLQSNTYEIIPES